MPGRAGCWECLPCSARVCFAAGRLAPRLSSKRLIFSGGLPRPTDGTGPEGRRLRSRHNWASASVHVAWLGLCSHVEEQFLHPPCPPWRERVRPGCCCCHCCPGCVDVVAAAVQVWSAAGCAVCGHRPVGCRGLLCWCLAGGGRRLLVALLCPRRQHLLRFPLAAAEVGPLLCVPRPLGQLRPIARGSVGRSHVGAMLASGGWLLGSNSLRGLAQLACFWLSAGLRTVWRQSCLVSHPAGASVSACACLTDCLVVRRCRVLSVCCCGCLQLCKYSCFAAWLASPFERLPGLGPCPSLAAEVA